MTNKEKKIFREMKDKAINDYMLFRDNDDLSDVTKNLLFNISLVYIELEESLGIKY